MLQACLQAPIACMPLLEVVRLSCGCAGLLQCANPSMHPSCINACNCLFPAETEYTLTFYLAMLGPKEAFNSLTPANMRTVAATLHDTLGLSDAYSADNIKV